MGLSSSSGGTTQDSIPGLQAAERWKYAGTETYDTLAALNADIVKERGNVDAASAVWRTGMRFRVVGEPCPRSWFQGASGTLSHARTLDFGSGKTLALVTDANVSTVGTGTPTGGADGDAFTDWTLGLVWQRTAGTWAVALTLATVSSEGLYSWGGRKFGIVAGVVRNLDDGAGWTLIDAAHTGANHSSLNVSGVSNTTATVSVAFAGLDVKNIISFLAVPDETLAAQGFSVGSSVTLTQADIIIRRTSYPIADYIFWDTSGTPQFRSQNSVFTIGSFTAGSLTLTHPTVSTVPLTVTLDERDGGYRCMWSTASSGTTILKFYDWAANTLVTTGDANFKVQLNRGPASGNANPNLINNTTFPSCNIWVYGIFELN